jgi:hypothetical protein
MKPSLSTRRGRLLVRCLVLVSIVAVTAAIFASPVAADKPTKSEYQWNPSSVLTDVCSFPVSVDSKISVTEIAYYNASGALTRIYDHMVEQDTFTANGKTLVGIPFPFNIEILFDNSGNLTHYYADGVVEKIPLPDGSLFVSAGRIDWVNHTEATFLLSPDKGNPGNVAGFCAALAP